VAAAAAAAAATGSSRLLLQVFSRQPATSSFALQAALRLLLNNSVLDDAIQQHIVEAVAEICRPATVSWLSMQQQQQQQQASACQQDSAASFGPKQQQQQQQPAWELVPQQQWQRRLHLPYCSLHSRHKQQPCLDTGRATAAIMQQPLSQLHSYNSRSLTKVWSLHALCYMASAELGLQLGVSAAATAAAAAVAATVRAVPAAVA
jgi:hypothetical protein